MYFHFHYRFHCKRVLLVTATMLSFVMCSVLANEESTRNVQNTNQAAAMNYSNKVHNNNNVDVDDDNDPLSSSKTYSKYIIQEVMPNYKKLKKDTNQSTNTDANSFHGTKRKTKVKNAFASNSKRSSIFFIYNTSNKLNENLLHKSSLSSSIDDNQHNVVDVTTIESVGHQQKIIEMDNVNTKPNQINIDKNENNNSNGLPGIIDVPTVMVTDLPGGILQSTPSLDSIVLDNQPKQQRNKIDYYKERFKNLTIDIVEDTTEEILKGEEFNATVGAQVTNNYNPDIKKIIMNHTADDIPIDINQTNITTKHSEHTSPSDTSTGQATETTTEKQNDTVPSILDKQQINLTTEEIPIPVFSEWAQKQMEAAEKQAALEQQEQTFNHSAQRKNHTKNGHAKKVSALKVRSKNYASPDCGAKIIASNSDAANTGAVLSSSRDEYMLSPCGNRIWFTVELCEAIQAQRIDLANFELFSSSPKNFTVAVANRFPTRDWSNVGRFIAEDRRTVQSFELHPHLFGKYVRIDIHTHYAKEHFCPVSLFRVFGTSEFEAFETENLPNQNLDDFEDDEDEIIEEQEGRTKPNEPNIFKSASDAVLSIVKKAAEVLVKPEKNANQMKSLHEQQRTVICQTPVKGYFNCTECNQNLIERVNSLISCGSQQLIKLLHISRLKDDLLTTHICDKSYGTIETKNIPFLEKNEHTKMSYYINILPIEYIGALCQLMMETEGIRVKNLKERANASISSSWSKRSRQHKHQQKIRGKYKAELMAANVTLENKFMSDDNGISSLSTRTKKITQSLHMIELENISNSSPRQSDPLNTTVTDSTPMDEFMQLPKPHVQSNMDFNILDSPTTLATTATNIDNTTDTIASDSDTTSASASYSTSDTKSQIADVNIFNVPDVVTDHHPNITIESSASEKEYDNTESPNNADNDNDSINYVPIVINASSSESANHSEDTNSWENIENLLSTSDSVNTNMKTVPDMPTTVYLHNGNNLLQQQKITSGPHTESVFIRLSNRIKTLELNMSLSGQYLEELSRRYKKQVEELQQALSQQTLNVRMLEERNRRHQELEQLYALHTAELKNELGDLILQVHACIVVIIFVGTFVFLVLMVGILFYRSMRRDTKEVLSLYNSTSADIKKKQSTMVNTMGAQATNVKKANRRKSCGDFSNHRHQETASNTYELDVHKHETNSHSPMEISNNAAPALTKGKNMLRQRKMSVCYSSQNHANYLNGIRVKDVQNAGAECTIKKPNTKSRRAKHSWPNTAHSQMQAGHRLKELHLEVKKICDTNKAAPIVTIRKCGLTDSNHTIRSRKKNEIQQRLKHIQPAPIECSLLDKTTQIPIKLDDKEVLTAEYNENLRLDTYELDNFLHTVDVQYNEFMPDNSLKDFHCSLLPSPSPPQTISIYNINQNGISQCYDSNVNGDDGGLNSKIEKSNKTIKNIMMNNNNSIKSRLSSPTFFKTSFKKGFKSKTSKKHTQHESTSWEWHRLKKTMPTDLTTTVAKTPTSTAIISHSLLPSVTKALTKSPSPTLSPLSSIMNHNNNVDISPLSKVNYSTTNSVDNVSKYSPILEDVISFGANMHHHPRAIKNNLLLTNNIAMDNLNDNNHFNNSCLNSGTYNAINGSGGSSSSTSNSSTCSSSQSTKTKNNRKRTFNKIFRKVFWD